MFVQLGCGVLRASLRFVSPSLWLWGLVVTVVSWKCLHYIVLLFIVQSVMAFKSYFLLDLGFQQAIWVLPSMLRVCLQSLFLYLVCFRHIFVSPIHFNSVERFQIQLHAVHHFRSSILNYVQMLKQD